MEYIDSIFNLKNRVAVITGGSGVLGRAMAKGLLNAGAKVILLARNMDKLNEEVKLLEGTDNNVIAFTCDVLDENNIITVQQKILEKFKRVDILINSAGGNIAGATIGVNQNIFDLKIEEFKKVTDLNLNGTVLPSLVFGKTMADQKGGSIINISSMAASRVLTRVVGYSAAKAAVDNFTKWMAVELAIKFGDGVRVNAIAPGFLLTEQNRTLLTNEDGSLTDRGKTIISITPFRRFGDPDELIGGVLYLASDASKFVTGTVIPIDGGFSAFSGV